MLLCQRGAGCAGRPLNNHPLQCCACPGSLLAELRPLLRALPNGEVFDIIGSVSIKQRFARSACAYHSSTATVFPPPPVPSLPTPARASQVLPLRCTAWIGEASHNRPSAGSVGRLVEEQARHDAPHLALRAGSKCARAPSLAGRRTQPSNGQPARLRSDAKKQRAKELAPPRSMQSLPGSIRPLRAGASPLGRFTPGFPPDPIPCAHQAP